MGRLDDKVAIITGGGTGIGRATAELFLAEDAEVAIVGRREEPLAKTASELGCAYVVNDISDSQKAYQTASEVKSRYGKISILVNNAGVLTDDTDVVGHMESLTETLENNLNSALYMSRAAIINGDSTLSIVNVASILSELGAPGHVAYTASKGALVAVSRQMAISEAGRGVRVNCVSPTVTEGTPMIDKLFEEQPELRGILLKRHPLGHFAKAGDVAQAILYLASDESRCITGQNLIIDCGRTIYGE